MRHSVVVSRRRENKPMAEAQNDIGAVYDALRCDLIQLLMEHRSHGRFTRAAEGSDQERSLFLAELTRSIADILVTAYPQKDARIDRSST